MHKRACQLQDSRHACLFHIAMLLVVQNACPRPGPFLARIRLNKPFLSDKLLTMKAFVWHLSEWKETKSNQQREKLDGEKSPGETRCKLSRVLCNEVTGMFESPQWWVMTKYVKNANQGGSLETQHPGFLLDHVGNLCLSHTKFSDSRSKVGAQIKHLCV